ncbi:transglutaminase domain-containing protein [Pelotomaculum propionicicum]|uniref:transglutaminase domain-containing protein n=1 Tax=Pelotomaculum propionicicum TaxID=258475 RepID=UPI003B7FBCCD
MIFKKKHKIFIKIITLILAVTFSFNFVFPTNLVYAASQYEQHGLNGQGEGAKNGPKTKLGSLSQGLSGHFKEIKGHAGKKEVGSLRASVKNIKKALADSKRGVYQEFDDNESTLKKIGASTAVARQREFRDQFRKKTAELEAIIEELDSISNQGETFDAIEAAGLDEKLTRMQELITVEEEHNPLGSDLPHRNIQMQPPPPAIGGGITPAYMSSEMQAAGSVLPWQPTPEDLAETRETRFTPDIIEMADSLSSNPVEIYESVRNNITFEPYYGSRKGATGTLQQSSGNDFDQASLLIALLRYKNIPARYVTGTVEIPVDRVMSWTGTETHAAAVQALGSMGIPVTSVVTEGSIASVQLEHTWVEAYVPYENYRGIGSGTGEAVWVPLDPSFKLNNKIQGLNLEEITGISREDLLAVSSNAGVISPDGLSVTRVDTTELETLMNTAIDRINTYVQENNLESAKTVDITGGMELIPENLGVLPLTLPYNTVSIAQELTAIPDSLCDWVGFSIKGANPFGLFFDDTEDFSYRAFTADLHGKKITLSWVPATVEDENVLNHYGGIFNTPPYLLQMIPQLKIDGQIAASGNPVSLGYRQEFTLTLGSPGMPEEKVVNPVFAGALYCIGLDLGSISVDEINKIASNLENLKAVVNESNIYSEEGMGEILDAVVKGYFGQVDAINNLIANQYGVKSTRFLSEGISGYNPKIGYMFYAPVEISEGGLFIDVDRDAVGIVSKNGDRQAGKAYMLSAGIIGSAMEHGIFEQMMETPSVSTIKVLQEANARGVPIYAVTKENIEDVLPNLDVSQSVKNDVVNAVNAGKTVTIPGRSIQYYGWSGTGYIILDQSSGSAAYMITGGLAGGSMTLDEVLAKYVESLINGIIGIALFEIGKLILAAALPGLIGYFYVVAIGLVAYYAYDLIVRYITGDEHTRQEVMIELVAALTLGVAAKVITDIAPIKGLVDRMKLIGVERNVTWDFVRTYGIRRINEAETVITFFKNYGMSNDLLAVISESFDRQIINLVKNTLEESTVKFTEADINVIVSLFKKVSNYDEGISLKSDIIVLSNNGIYPAAYDGLGIRSPFFLKWVVGNIEEIVQFLFEKDNLLLPEPSGIDPGTIADRVIDGKDVVFNDSNKVGYLRARVEFEYLTGNYISSRAPTFKGVDDWIGTEVISCKTYDTRAKSNQGIKLGNNIIRDIRKLFEFEGHRLKDLEVLYPDDYNSKAIRIGIPDYKLTSEQLQGIQNAIQFAEDNLDPVTNKTIRVEIFVLK